MDDTNNFGNKNKNRKEQDNSDLIHIMNEITKLKACVRQLTKEKTCSDRDIDEPEESMVNSVETRSRKTTSFAEKDWVAIIDTNSALFSARAMAASMAF